MATEPLSMRQIREILRQKWVLRLSPRAVASSLRVGLGTISSVVSRVQAAGLNWSQVQTLADEALEGRLYGRPDVAGQRQRSAPDCAWIHTERRRPGVTLELLHLEYLERYPDAYRYTRFCDLYRRWLACRCQRSSQ
jgi:transposase